MVKILPLIAILVLLLTAFVMVFLKNKKQLIFFAIGVNFLCFFMILISTINYGGTYSIEVGHYAAPFGITFYMTSAALMIGLMVTFVISMISWYSYYTIEKEIDEGKERYFYILINLLVASILGLIFTDDLFNAYVFLELGTLTACGLIVVKSKGPNLKAAMKYLILSVLGSGLVLMGIAYLYAITGHLNMHAIHDALINTIDHHERMIGISMVLFTFGLGIKSALFPLHIWLPDAHGNAPTPSSAILSGLVIKGPVFMMLKMIVYVYGVELVQTTNLLTVIMIMAASGMIGASVLAIYQKDIKRMIAYSSVAQMGYIYLAISLGTELGFIVAVYHIIAHGVTKPTLFLTVGAFYEQAGTKEISKFSGIGKWLPVTLGIYSLGALSMVGIPVLPGFITKWNLSLASIEVEAFALLFVILVSSLLNAVYYLPVVINGYFGAYKIELPPEKQYYKPVKELIPVIIMGIAIVVVGFGSAPILEFIRF